jgi:branched-chain amino acid transport system ATP-binding protein
MVMDAGEIISEGVMKDILADPKVHAAYFETFSNVGDDSKVDRISN